MKIAFIFGIIFVCGFAFCKEETDKPDNEASDIDDPACKSINIFSISNNNRHIWQFTSIS